MIPYIKIVRQYERLGLFWLGRFTAMKGPGMQILLWPFHKSTIVDLRETVIDIPRQTNITKDNAPIDIDFLVYMRVMENESHKAILEVVDYGAAVVGIATTTLRAVIGDLTLDEVLSQRERINEELRLKL
ncbi:MAG: paraslipin, partial [SAR202 cluster bacterium]|nr:paraslipin [SAR202 cluster bacterium]